MKLIHEKELKLIANIVGGNETKKKKSFDYITFTNQNCRFAHQGCLQN